jgi:putative holliday junction resolvase
MIQERILGVDFGTKKVGIAISDKYGNFALPKVVLKNDKTLIQNIEDFIKKENISEIVIGKSINYKGEENPIMQDIRVFVGILENRFNLKVYLEPEFLTSSQVRNTQGDSKMIDASAAALILQSFLDKREKVEERL